MRKDSLKKQFSLVDNFPKYGYDLRQAMLASGYSEETYKKKGFKTLQNAMYAVQQAGERIHGFTKQELIGELKKLVYQDQDKATKLRAIQGLLRYHGVELVDHDKPAQANPTINVGIIQKGEAIESVSERQPRITSDTDTEAIDETSHTEPKNAPESETNPEDDISTTSSD